MSTSYVTNKQKILQIFHFNIYLLHQIGCVLHTSVPSTVYMIYTESQIQVVLTYLQVFPRLGGWRPPEYPSQICVQTASVSGRSWMQLADDNALLLLRTQTVTFGPWAFTTSRPDALNTLLSELSHSSVSLDCFKRSMTKSFIFLSYGRLCDDFH